MQSFIMTVLHPEILDEIPYLVPTVNHLMSLSQKCNTLYSRIAFNSDITLLRMVCQITISLKKKFWTIQNGTILVITD